jgi:hypothetical protein
METSSLESWVRATARAMLVHMDDIAERRREAFASSSSVRASREASPTAGLRGAGIAAGVLEGEAASLGETLEGLDAVRLQAHPTAPRAWAAWQVASRESGGAHCRLTLTAFGRAGSTSGRTNSRKCQRGAGRRPLYPHCERVDKWGPQAWGRRWPRGR